MPRGIQLAPQFQGYYAAGETQGFRIVVTARNAVGMPNEVFAFLGVPVQPGATVASATFSHVCTPSELEDYPVGQPAVNANPPWFRLAVLDQVYPTRGLAMLAYESVLDDVNGLKATLDLMDVLTALPVVQVGDAPGP